MAAAFSMTALLHPAGAALAQQIGIDWVELFTHPAARGIAECVQTGRHYLDATAPAHHNDAAAIWRCMEAVGTLDGEHAEHLVRRALRDRIGTLLRAHCAEIAEAENHDAIRFFQETAELAVAADALDIERLDAVRKGCAA